MVTLRYRGVGGWGCCEVWCCDVAWSVLWYWVLVVDAEVEVEVVHDARTTSSHHLAVIVRLCSLFGEKSDLYPTTRNRYLTLIFPTLLHSSLPCCNVPLQLRNTTAAEKIPPSCTFFRLLGHNWMEYIVGSNRYEAGTTRLISDPLAVSHVDQCGCSTREEVGLVSTYNRGRRASCRTVLYCDVR
jgi:hypothetical protein